MDETSAVYAVKNRRDKHSSDHEHDDDREYNHDTHVTNKKNHTVSITARGFGAGLDSGLDKSLPGHERPSHRDNHRLPT